MNFFGIGLPEMAVIAAIGLLVFGPKRLPELGKTLGKTLRGFQTASQDFEKEFRQAVAPEAEASAAHPSITETSPSLASAGSPSTEIPVTAGAPASTHPAVVAAAANAEGEPGSVATPAAAGGDAAGS